MHGANTYMHGANMYMHGVNMHGACTCTVQQWGGSLGSKEHPFCSLNNRIVGVAYPYSGEMMKRTPPCESSVSSRIPLMGEFLLYLPI